MAKSTAGTAHRAGAAAYHTPAHRPRPEDTRRYGARGRRRSETLHRGPAAALHRDRKPEIPAIAPAPALRPGGPTARGHDEPGRGRADDQPLPSLREAPSPAAVDHHRHA